MPMAIWAFISAKVYITNQELQVVILLIENGQYIYLPHKAVI